MKAYVLIPFLLRGLVTASPQSGSGLQACGDAFYHPSSVSLLAQDFSERADPSAQYTCYESNFLCPIIDGEPTLKCGDSCYLPNMYSYVHVPSFSKRHRLTDRKAAPTAVSGVCKVCFRPWLSQQELTRSSGLAPICPNLAVKDHGCIRCQYNLTSPAHLTSHSLTA